MKKENIVSLFKSKTNQLHVVVKRNKLVILKTLCITNSSSVAGCAKKIMMLNFKESGHPVFRGTSTLDRGTLKSKGGGQLSFPFCRDSATAELMFRIFTTVIQLSMYGKFRIILSLVRGNLQQSKSGDNDRVDSFANHNKNASDQ